MTTIRQTRDDRGRIEALAEQTHPNTVARVCATVVCRYDDAMCGDSAYLAQCADDNLGRLARKLRELGWP